MIPHVTAPTFRPLHQTSYEQRVVTFRAPCPACMDDCRWTATAADGATPHCPCDFPASTTGKTSAPGTSSITTSVGGVDVTIETSTLAGDPPRWVA